MKPRASSPIRTLRIKLLVRRNDPSLYYLSDIPRKSVSCRLWNDVQISNAEDVTKGGKHYVII